MKYYVIWELSFMNLATTMVKVELSQKNTPQGYHWATLTTPRLSPEVPTDTGMLFRILKDISRFLPPSSLPSLPYNQSLERNSARLGHAKKIAFHIEFEGPPFLFKAALTFLHFEFWIRNSGMKKVFVQFSTNNIDIKVGHLKYVCRL